MGIQKDRVRLNIGGRIFETTTTTLANASRNSLFGAMFDENWNQKTTDEYFIDRNPDGFAVLHDLLRTGELFIPSDFSERLLYREAQFYGILDQVRSAKWGPFDGTSPCLVLSVTCRAPCNGRAIRASPDGGCCLSNDNVVRVYNWMFEEHTPIILDYRKVNDVGWADSENIVISGSERFLGDGIMGLLNAYSGELKHKFLVKHEKQEDLVIKSYTAGSMSFGSDYKLFASCICTGIRNEITEEWIESCYNDEYHQIQHPTDRSLGIGVWDQITGKQIDFFKDDEPKTPDGDRSLGSNNAAGKLQWLHGTNCLLVSTFIPGESTRYNCCIKLLDFRVKKSGVLSWSVQFPDNHTYGTNVGVRDVLAIEETNSICVVNEYEDLGFMDLRRVSGIVCWKKRNIFKIPNNEGCYPKLAFHKGQLFSSFNDSISVFCGPDWVLTSKLPRSSRGSICDFSIGGDRLFALHSEESVFDIWETPSRY